MTNFRRGLQSVGLAFVVAACSSSTPTPSIRPPGSPLPGDGQPSQRPGSTQGAGSTAAGGGGFGGGGGPTGVPPTPVAPNTPIAGLDQLTGSDGRFTMLILGSDARAHLAGERTDTIMVITIDPATGKVSMVSLPRDTERVPIGPGHVYGPKVTGLFQDFRLSRGDNREQQFRDMVKAIGFAFGIEIDRYALAHFNSVVRMINAIGGIDVKLKKPFVDPTAHVGRKGLRLKAGVNHLNGNLALAFARSRHTTSDYDRARRQQLVISVAIQKVLGMGVGALPALTELAFANNTIETDLKVDDVPALYGLAQEARLSHFRSVVLGPSLYESGGGPPTYATFMNVGAVRALFSRIFGRH
jgi:polyisoprenyl-teichoic acid--peptidoglycan teichoic acid transferase